jgi:putative oxidoreductase
LTFASWQGWRLRVDLNSNIIQKGGAGMADFKKTASEDLGKLLIRIAVAGIVLFHGWAKLMHGVEWIKQPLGLFGLPGFLAYWTYIGEIIPPVLIILGYRTRPAALVVACDVLLIGTVEHR